MQARHRQMGTQLKLRLMMWKGEEGREKRWKEATPTPWPVCVNEASAFRRQEYLELPASSVGRVEVDMPDDGYVAVASGEYEHAVHDWYGWAVGSGKAPKEYGPEDRGRVAEEAREWDAVRRQEEQERERRWRPPGGAGVLAVGARSGEGVIGGVAET